MDWWTLPLPLDEQQWLFFGLLFAFAVKVPMWPVHTWLPDAHVEAPTGGSVVLAAIMLKLGAYGFVRFTLPILPDASRDLAWLMIALSLIAVVYIGLVALVQTDMKKLIAYSSISHMGFVTLGFFIFQQLRDRGRADPDDLARLRLGGDVPLRRRDVRPHALARHRRLRRRGEHHAQVRRADDAVRDGQLRPAGHQRLRRRVHGDHGRDEGQLLARLCGRHHAGVRRRLHAVDVQARDLRRGGERSCRALKDLNSREFLVLGLLAAAVLFMGIYPLPFTEVMHASVNDLLRHVALPKY
jgi:NADH-quinone oxidoreductase subunit M